MRAACVLLALLLAGAADAALPPQAALPPEWDARGEPAPAATTPEQAAALARLQSEATGKLTFVAGPGPGTLHHLFRRGGALSPPSPGPPEDVARAFVARHRDILGLRPADVRELDLRAVVRDPSTRAAHVVLAQAVDGLPVFGAAARVHLDHEGRVVSVTGDTARVGRPAPEPSWGSPGEALARAAALTGMDATPLPPVERVDPDGTIRFARGSFASAPWASRAWFPMRDGALRAAWVVTLDPPGATWPQLVLDAATWAPLSRVELVDHAATEGLVFREDPSRSPQVVVPFVDGEAVTDDASPFGWSAAGTTSGNNCHVADDRDGNDEDVAGRTAAGAAGPPLSFSFPFTGSPADDLDASLTNLFWLNNWLHDRLARLGFDEASGNFQAINASGEGRGGDAVRVDAQDGAGLNNANFGTPPDGFPPRMQMFLWTVTDPWRDSGFDGSVVTHELLHGVSNRLVGLAGNHAGCLSGPQGNAMGEAWSDFYACSFWNAPVVGAWLVDDPLRGIRRAPYDDYPFHYGELCNQGGFEVHRDGEIWAATLWDLRARLIERHGAWEGRCRAERLVLDGMKLSPCSPTFVDMRDAILLAAGLRGEDGDACLLWEAFAARGLGTGAVARSGCTTAADASFEVPAECASCASLAPPSGLTLDASRPNEVVARFTPSPGASEHVLLRAPGACPGACSEAAFEVVARGGPAATSLAAGDVAGDLTAGGRFAFRVVALRGACTAGTACAEAVVQGRCTLPPVPAAEGPAGVTALTREPGAACAVRVHWAAARSRCGLPEAVRHSVYRSPDPAFVPGPEHLVAVVPAPAASWLDLSVPDAEVTYVVRAEDLTTGGAGPHGGNEEANDARLTTSPLGEPAGTATVTHDGESGEGPGFRRTQTLPANDWALVADGNTRGGFAWHAEAVEGGNAEKSLHLPPMTFGPAPRLRFAHAFDFEDGYDGGVLEISLDGGRTWRDLIDDIVAGGYATSAGRGITVSASELIHEPNVESLWTGENASGFPAYDVVEVDLAPYARAHDAQVRFRMIVDPLVADPGGWYVDDVVAEDVVAFGPCVSGCDAPPVAVLPGAPACVPGAESTFALLDASGSRAGSAPLAADLAMVLTHDGPGSFGGRRWASGPTALLEVPPGTPEGDLSVVLTVRDARGCSSQAQAVVAVRAETFVPTAVGPTLRVTREGGDVRLAWAPTDAASYNVLQAALQGAGQAPAWRLAGRKDRPEALLPASGSRFLIVHAASDCGRSVP